MSLIIRLPNWLGDVVMALPVAAAILQKHPHSVFSGQATFAPLLSALGFQQEYRALPPKNWRYYSHFWQQRGQFSQAVLFANSQRSDAEAWLQGIPKRYGIAWQTRPRRLLTHRYYIRHLEQDGERHQSQLWTDFTAHFALQDGVSFAPLLPNADRASHIVLICGSENSPEKRWEVSKWRAFIQQLRRHSDAEILLCGTAKDKEICQAIMQDLALEQVRNLAGKTDMSEFFNLLRRAQCVIGNDTGGLHLANAAGTPTVGLYGPTNPQRTRPIFDAPLAIVQPKDCPASGGGKMADIAVEDVLNAWQAFSVLR